MLLVFSIFAFITLRVVTENQLEREVENELSYSQENMYEGISYVLNETNMLFFQIIQDVLFDTMLDDSYDTKENRDVLFGVVMDNIRKNENIFDAISIYYNDELFSEKSENLITDEYIRKVQESEDSITHVDVISDELFLVGKRIEEYSQEYDGGVFFFFINEVELRKLYQGLTPYEGYSFIISNDYEIISHSKGENIRSVLFDRTYFAESDKRTVGIWNNEKSIILTNGDDSFEYKYQTDWRIVTVLNYDNVYSRYNDINMYNIGIIVSVVLMSWILVYSFTKVITKPFHRIVRGLNKFSKTGTGSFEVKSNILELQDLEVTYENMITNISNLIRHKDKSAKLQRELELYALQMQIKPHFLYNTLDAIAWMAKINKQKDIEKLVLSLADFFRISLHKGDRIIKVKEEISLVNNYVIIETTRMPNKFDVEFDVDESIFNKNTIKLILQPIVENSIQHGLSQVSRKGKLIVKGYSDERFIYFEIIDDGKGFEVTPELLNNKSKRKEGYALRNVHERIQIEYGKDCGLFIESEPDKGTKVLVKIKDVVIQ